jgi:putative drug exporter of the RND superfamily
MFSLSALIRKVAMRPRPVLIGWLALVGALGLLGLRVESQLHSTVAVVPGSPSAKAFKLTSSRFGESYETPVLLEGPRSAVERQGTRLAARLERLPNVSLLTPWMPGIHRVLAPAGDRALLLVRSYGNFDHVVKDVVPDIRVAASDLVHAPVRSHVSGYGDIAQGIQQGTIAAIDKAELIAAPFLILVLLLVFRSPIAASLPLFIGFTTIGATRGTLVLVNDIYPLDALALNVASMMGLALGVDYALLMVSRVREELRPGVPPQHAVITAARVASYTIVSAGTALVACMATAVFVVPGNLLAGVGIGLIVAVVLSVLAAITALPASLALLGTRVNAGTFFHTGWAGRGRVGGLALRALQRPVVSGAIVLILMIALSAPITSLDTGPPDPRGLPSNSVEYRDYAAVKRALGSGWVAPIEIDVAARRGSLMEPGPMLALYHLEQALEARHDVAMVLGPGQILKTKPFLILEPPSKIHVPGASFVLNIRRGGTAARILVIGFGNPQKAGYPLRKVLERDLPPLAKATHATVLLGGTGIDLEDFDRATSNRLPLLLAWLALVTYVVLACVLRSLLLPLLAVVFNLLTVGVAFGVLVIGFQGSHPLFGGPGFTDAITAFGVTSVMFGLSIDYEVFLLTRIRESYLANESTVPAIEYGLKRTAGIVTGAALIMTVVFAAFGTSQLIAPKQLGVALTLAVMLDATVVRLILLPCAMRLCGDAIWWFPRPLSRMFARLRFASADSA